MSTPPGGAPQRGTKRGSRLTVHDSAELAQAMRVPMNSADGRRHTIHDTASILLPEAAADLNPGPGRRPRTWTSGETQESRERDGARLTNFECLDVLALAAQVRAGDRGQASMDSAGMVSAAGELSVSAAAAAALPPPAVMAHASSAPPALLAPPTQALAPMLRAASAPSGPSGRMPSAEAPPGQSLGTASSSNRFDAFHMRTEVSRLGSSPASRAPQATASPLASPDNSTHSGSSFAAPVRMGQPPQSAAAMLSALQGRSHFEDEMEPVEEGELEDLDEDDADGGESASCAEAGAGGGSAQGGGCEERPMLHRPCAMCRAAKVRCNREDPCSRCRRLGLECRPPPTVPRGRPSHHSRLLQLRGHAATTNEYAAATIGSHVTPMIVAGEADAASGLAAVAAARAAAMAASGGEAAIAAMAAGSHVVHQLEASAAAASLQPSGMPPQQPPPPPGASSQPAYAVHPSCPMLVPPCALQPGIQPIGQSVIDYSYFNVQGGQQPGPPIPGPAGQPIPMAVASTLPAGSLSLPVGSATAVLPQPAGAAAGESMQMDDAAGAAATGASGAMGAPDTGGAPPAAQRLDDAARKLEQLRAQLVALGVRPCV